MLGFTAVVGIISSRRKVVGDKATLQILMVIFVCVNLSKSLRWTVFFLHHLSPVLSVWKESFAASLQCVHFDSRACLKLTMLLEAGMLHRLAECNRRVIQCDRSCAGSTCSVQPRL